MSTSLLYHAFGVRGYQHVRTSYVRGEVHFHIVQPREKLRCSHCGGKQVGCRGEVQRSFLSVPIGGKTTRIIFPVPRVFCQECETLRQVEIGFAQPRRGYTQAFERYVLQLCRHMTIRDVAQHTGASWDVIKDIQKRRLQRDYGQPNLKRLKQLQWIAIDEISIRKGFQFLTLVLDMQTGEVVFIGKTRRSRALDPFWKLLQQAGAQVEAVATDMSLAYIEAVMVNLPKAAIVFDHFHLIKLVNDKLTTLRRQLHRQATDTLEKKVLKGTRWLLLKDPHKLNPDQNEQQKLEEALQLNESLAIAYYLKEDLRQLWRQGDKRTAMAFLDDWTRRAMASGVKVLQTLAQTLLLKRQGILNWYDYPITTGPLEGINNKIKTMFRQAYGFRDLDFLKLKIFAIHKSKYALVG